jgi:small subunit ribosomal protein S3
MGQKVSPVSFRLGYTKCWDSQWFAGKKEFAKNLLEDLKVREFILKEFKSASVSRVKIERSSDKVRVNIYTARPGVIIGRRGADIDRLRDTIMKMIGKEIQVNIREIKNPNLDAQLVSENIALQLEKRISFRRAMKKAIQQTREAGAKGIKLYTKGRLGGSEIARQEGYHVGSVPLHTLRANIDYGFSEAKTTYGIIGIKVWIYKGDFVERPNIYKLDELEVAANDQVKRAPRPERDGRRHDGPEAPAANHAPAVHLIEPLEATGDEDVTA